MLIRNQERILMENKSGENITGKQIEGIFFYQR
jgi:hypothetical protein